MTGLFPVRSPLLGESRLISLPPGTEMFHFPGLAPLRVMGHDSHWVSPFGHPRIKACFLLPAAFRRLLRPSSPLCAKASTVCPLQLAVCFSSCDFRRFFSSPMLAHCFYAFACFLSFSSLLAYRLCVVMTRSRSSIPFCQDTSGILLAMLTASLNRRLARFTNINLFCFQRTL